MNTFISWFPLLLILGLFALWVRLIVRANRRARAHMEKRFYPYPSAQERARQHNPDDDDGPWITHGPPGPARFFGDEP